MSLAVISAVVLVFSLTAVAWALGELTKKPGEAGCVSDTGSGGACQDGRALRGLQRIAISPDGKNAYVTTSFGAENTGTVAIFDRDPVTGELKQKEGEAACISDDGTDKNGGICTQSRELDFPTAVAISADGKSAYIASAGSDAVTIFDRDPDTGELTQKAGKAGCLSETGSGDTCQNGRALDGPQNLTVSPDGMNVYASSGFSDAVTIIDRDPDTGELTQKEGEAGCVSENGTDKAGGICQDGRELGFSGPITISPDGRNIYVATHETNAVAIFDRDPDTGELTQKQGKAGCVSETGSNETCQNGEAIFHGNDIDISPDEKSVYVSSFSGTTSPGAVAIFDRDPDTGELTQKPGTAGCITEGGSGGICGEGRALSFAEGIAVSPDDGSVYLASLDFGLAIFDRNTANGELTQKPGRAGCITQTGNEGACQSGLQSSIDTTVSPDGKNVYVASDGLVIFDRGGSPDPPAPDDTATELECAQASVIIGNSLSCTATVTDETDNAKHPTGTVNFRSNNSSSFPDGASCQLPGTDSNECTVTYRPEGTVTANRTDTLTAEYAGDTGFNSSDDSFELTVEPEPAGGNDDTATELECAQASVMVGNPVSCTAAVTDETDNSKHPSGAINFRSTGQSSFPVGCQLPGTANDECTVTYRPEGTVTANRTDTLTAEYAGDTGFNSSDDSFELTVEPEPAGKHQTKTTLVCSPSSIVLGAGSTCTATVVDELPGANSTGAVKFTSDSPGNSNSFANGGLCTLNGAGGAKATCAITYTPSQLGSGTHKVTAAYQGDTGHAQSQGSAQLAVGASITAAPATIIRKKPRKKTTSRLAKFKFISTQPGSSFECKLDKKRYNACRSPFKVKVKPGRHIFRVRAINAQGVVDPRPAAYGWKVGRIHNAR